MRHALQGVAAALVVLAGLAQIAQPSRRVLVTFAASAGVLIAASVRVRRPARSYKALAASLDSRRPQLQNVAVTAEELLRHPGRAPQWVRERVFADAAAALRSLPVSALWPVGRLVAGVAAAAAMAATSFALAPRGGIVPGVSTLAPGAADADVAIEVQLTPPPYTRKPIVRLQNPDRLQAIEGTVARVAVANARDVRIRLGARPLAVKAADGLSVIEARLTDSGYLAVEIGGSDGSPRLIADHRVPDRTPVVRIERPARDLLLPDARSSVEVAGSVADDIAIRALTLRYTKVSGSGEQFEFEEGELPLDIVKKSAQQWQARGRFRLRVWASSLGFAGLSAHCQDGRPGLAGTASSDTFFVEIAGPGQVALEGFEMPPEQERYALSQQMIVLKLAASRA